MGSIWTNPDGLRVHFGTRDSDNELPGAVAGNGARRQISLEIIGVNLADAGAPRPEGAVLPAGSRLTRAELHVETSFTSGGAAVLDIGLYGLDDLAAIDDDGIDAAIALAALVTTDPVIVCDGALIGDIMAEDTLIAASFDTAAYTAGVATLLVEYVIPEV